MNPKVSVIIPNYNHAAFLEQRINSVLNQSFQDIEVILLDDNSSDQSAKIIRKFENHPKVSHIIFNDKNSGSTFYQWNKGIELSKADYIWIAESDDYAELNFLEKLYPIIATNTNINIVYCHSHIIDTYNKIIGDGSIFYNSTLNERWKNDFIISGVKEIENQLIFWNTIPNASAAIIRKEPLININFPFHYKINGDWFLWIQLLLNGDLAYVSEKLNYFRKHEKTVRKKEVASGRNILEYSDILCFINLHKIVSNENLKSGIKNLEILWHKQPITKVFVNFKIKVNILYLDKKMGLVYLFFAFIYALPKSILNLIKRIFSLE